MKKSALRAFYAKPRHDAGNWAAKTQGFDFSREDRVDAAKYNLIQWQGLMGENMPYPAARDGRDLRKNRKALLKKWRESRMASFTQHQAAEQTGGRQVGSARRLRNTGSLHDQKRRRAMHWRANGLEGHQGVGRVRGSAYGLTGRIGWVNEEGCMEIPPPQSTEWLGILDKKNVPRDGWPEPDQVI